MKLTHFLSKIETVKQIEYYSSHRFVKYVDYYIRDIFEVTHLTISRDQDVLDSLIPEIVDIILLF